MKYVLDASTGFKALVREHLSDKAERLREDYRNGTHALLAPDVFPVEVSHALTRAERQGRITPAEGGKLFAELMTTLPAIASSLSLLSRAYVISSQARVGVYDCLYIALAEREGYELVTADNKLLNNLQPQFPFIVPLASLP